MLHTVFLRYFNISVTTGVLIGILLLLAPFFRKRYTVKWKYWVWLLLAARLILPITIPETKAAIVVNVPHVDLVQPSVQSPEKNSEGEEALNVNQPVAEPVDSQTEANSDKIPQTKDETVDVRPDRDMITSGMAEKTNNTLPILEPISLWDVIAGIWILGIAVYVLYHLIGHQVFRKSILRRSKIPADNKISGVITDISAEIELKKRIRIKICRHVISPMVMGLVRPILILPKEEYTEEELRYILLHELYHCKRNDLWYKLTLLTANAIHWYNPFVWLMCRAANGDLERSCDDEVLSDASYEDRKAYTGIILDGISAQVTHENNLSTYFYGGKKELKNRFANILDKTRRRSGKKVLLAVLMCILVIGSTVACVYGNGTEAESDDTNSLHDIEDIPPAEEVAEEDIYEVLETEDAVYRATRYGISRTTEDGSEWIYKAIIGQAGFAGNKPQMKVYDNRLYLQTNIIYKDGDLDWIDCGIRWIDLETLETDILDLDLGSDYPTIEHFYFYDNLLNVQVNADGAVQRDMWFLAPVKEKEVYNGKTVSELTEQERQEYGCEISRWLTENPGTLLDVSNHTTAGPFALVDMNMDGKAEEISLQMAEVGYVRYDIFNRYSLLLDGEVVVEDSYAANLNNNIWAVSLDGKEIVIMIYEDGASADPYTRIFRYEDTSLVEVGGIYDEVAKACEIGKFFVDKATEVAEKDTFEEGDIYIGSISYGKFSQTSDWEMLVLCKFRNGVHLAGEDRTMAMVFDGETMELIANKNFGADEVVLHVLPTQSGSKILFLGRVIYQGIPTQYVELYAIEEKEWVEVPLQGVEVQEEGELCYINGDNSLSVVPWEFGQYAGEVVSLWDEQTLYGWDEGAERFVHKTVSSESAQRINWEDLDGDGQQEYFILSGDAVGTLSLYFNNELIYQYEEKDLSIVGIDRKEYIDLDNDGEQEIFVSFFPNVNSMPLVEWFVLKKGENGWTPMEMYHENDDMTQNAFPISVILKENDFVLSITCDGCDKEIVYDATSHYEQKKEEEREWGDNSYNLFVESNFNVGDEVGSTSAWGIWNIESGSYEGQNCLVAEHGLQGPNDKYDFYGYLDVYFAYDENAKIKILDIAFRENE